MPKFRNQLHKKHKNSWRCEMNGLAGIIRKLLPELQQEVEDFIQFLMEKRAKSHCRLLLQDWTGALKD